MAVQEISTLQKRLQRQKGGQSIPRQTMAGGFGAALNGEKPTTNVSEIAGDMMGKDNPLMARARAQGAQSANRRGMLNSSAAAGEAANAVLDRVVPMASQEAQQRHAGQMSDREAGHRLRENEQQYGFASALSSQEAAQRADLSEQEFQQASSLSDQQFEQQFKMSREEYRQGLELQKRDQSFQSEMQEDQQAFQSELSEQEFAQAQSLSEQEFQQQFGLSREEYRQNLEIQQRDQSFERGQTDRAFQQERQLQKIQLASDKQLAKMDAQTRRQLMRMESGMRERLAQIDVDQQTKNSMSEMVTSMNSQYQNALNSILGNPNLPAEEREALLQNAGELLNLQVDMVSDLFDTKIDWAGGNFDITAPEPEEGDNADGGDTSSASSDTNTTRPTYPGR
ncbi:hypothetical protein [Phaeobacter gallaeciensis]|uniref:hypothetical protein n=1 Tax=Phaeobacter gallaeciensis TaxID=60890 RepID=UPI00237F07E7|nr:hypothetical protein [Phaeobacter gallaeciensis]MDE4189678.1 hypothetical protein [Phaeobacter gallaeciensis]MDE4198830.1 hypothetical protein [Phaeobacter gallaeciensis]MDE4202978.1 hypothetical protein [Phaeobacter gallaeciensis]MDE4207120.1 hypothetical protein [Phaeobacter gallaeciensis]MDE4215656.1 hypothetical protein [Phaeobacter gallaeciensis]